MVDNVNLTKAFDTMNRSVYIVTSAYRRRPAGCTAIWVNRASFEPPLVCAHMQPACHTMETIARGKRLCVNVLDHSSLALARRFGFTSGHNDSKFTDTGYRTSANGSPILEAAISYLDCKVKQVTRVGDHELVVAEVVEAVVIRQDSPLIYDPDTFYPSIRKRIDSLEQSEAEST